MKEKYTRQTALLLLKDKAQKLEAAGETRRPCRSDFAEEEVVAIKAFLGPWPRALEQAGLKPVSHPERETKRQERRILAKRKTTMAKIAARQVAKETSESADE